MRQHPPALNERIDSDAVYRILSVDGGGIYGLVSVLWLKQLCQENTTFLATNTPSPPKYIFAGASAGAVSLLLMAKHEDPREALLGGEAEDFWKARIGAFSNVVDPMAAWCSLFNMGGWFGAQDFQQLLRKHFGDMKLKDLKHPVFVTMFNWTGDRNPAHDSAWPSTSAFPYPFFFPRPAPRYEGDRRWMPWFASNFVPWMEDLPVASVAYWAATPPGLRAIQNGLGDAASYGADPSIDVVACLVSVLNSIASVKSAPNELEELLTEIQQYVGRGKGAAAVQKLKERLQQASRRVGDMLENLSVLSVGNGSPAHTYWLKDFNFSQLEMCMYPTNPYMGNYFPPNVSTQLDAPIAESNLLSLLFLSQLEPDQRTVQSRYFRLNPAIMKTPLLVATMLCRFQPWFDFFVREIEQSVRSSASQEQIKRTLRFLTEWQCEQPLTSTSGWG